MRMFSYETDITISIVKLLGTENEVDGVLLKVQKVISNDGFITGILKDRQIELRFGEEITL